MIDISKKYLQKRDDDHPHLGNFVHWFIKKQGVTKTFVAKQLDVNPLSLPRYFKHSSLQFSIIWRISKAINYNMVADLGQRLKIPFETEAEKELRAQLAEKEEVIKKMEIQLELLREMKK